MAHLYSGPNPTGSFSTFVEHAERVNPGDVPPLRPTAVRAQGRPRCSPGLGAVLNILPSAVTTLRFSRLGEGGGCGSCYAVWAAGSSSWAAL